MSGNTYPACTFNFVLSSLRHERWVIKTKKYSHELTSTQSSMLLHVTNHHGFQPNRKKEISY